MAGRLNRVWLDGKDLGYIQTVKRNEEGRGCIAVFNSKSGNAHHDRHHAHFFTCTTYVYMCITIAITNIMIMAIPSLVIMMMDDNDNDDGDDHDG